jgi:hypothetical protein
MTTSKTRLQAAASKITFIQIMTIRCQIAFAIGLNA